MGGGEGDKFAGKAKETFGSVTGDDSKKTEGQAQNLGGKVQSAVQGAGESIAGAAQGAKDTVVGKK